MGIEMRERIRGKRNDEKDQVEENKLTTWQK